MREIPFSFHTLSLLDICRHELSHTGRCLEIFRPLRVKIFKMSGTNEFRSYLKASVYMFVKEEHILYIYRHIYMSSRIYIYIYAHTILRVFSAWVHCSSKKGTSKAVLRRMKRTRVTKKGRMAYEISAFKETSPTYHNCTPFKNTRLKDLNDFA